MADLYESERSTGMREHRRPSTLRALGIGALATTGALVCLAVARPSVPAMFASPETAVPCALALVCLAAGGLLVATARSKAGDPAAAPAPGERVEPTPQNGKPSPPETAGSRMHATVDELAEGIVGAGLSRVLVFGSPGAKVGEAVALARRIAARDEPTILADFAGGGTAGELCLTEATESIAHVAASPTTFAHSIHRDRASRAHVMTARLDPADIADGTAAKAMASVLATLKEVYERVVVVVPPDAPGIGTLVGADTALLASADAADAMLAQLASQGLGDVILVAER